MSTRFVALGTALLAAVLATPSDALAQNEVASFRAEYTWAVPYPDPGNPIVAGPYRVRFTLYDNDTWVNDDGNGGEFDLDLGSGAITLWFFSEAEATATYPPFGAATWSGTLNAGKVCNGTTRGPATDPVTGYPITVTGTWHTRGCP